MHGRNEAMIRRYYPGYRSPKRVYEETLAREVGSETIWMDLGCGRCVVGDPDLNRELPRRARLVVGCDPDPGLKAHASVENLVRCDGGALPFRDGSFDLVTASMVLEHLEDPSAVFLEVARICKTGGRFIVFTPNVLNYGMVLARLTPHRFHLFYRKLTHYLARREWRDFEGDLYPTWYRANRLGRLRRLAEDSGFVVECLDRLAFAHTFGFVKPLYVASLLFERGIDRPGLDLFKADLLGVFRRESAVVPERSSGGG